MLTVESDLGHSFEGKAITPLLHEVTAESYPAFPSERCILIIESIRHDDLAL